MKLDYSYGTTANNGNVLSQTITVPTVGASTGFSAVQTYNYDSLNRLKDATESLTPTGGSATETWKQTFTFDRFGNRNFDEANTTTLPKNCGSSPSFTVCTSDKKKFNPSVQTANNRLVLDQDNDSTPDYAFDSSGNTTKDADSRTFVYDAENKQIEVKNSSNATIGQYFYDGDGKRVKKYVPDTGEVTIFVYDAVGKLVAEYSTIVADTNDAKVAYLTNDHLGSPRINTDINGNVTARHDYHPFGEEITTNRPSDLGYAGDEIRKQFTGYERDNESGLDYAQARMYIPSQGRFSSPDPALSTWSASVPQSINKLSYAANNPLRYTDPLGLYVCETKNFSNECAAFESARADMEKRLGKLNSKSKEYADLKRSIDAYGASGVDNGVTVTFGATGTGTPAHTVGFPNVDKDGNKIITPQNAAGQATTVTFDLAQFGGLKKLDRQEFSIALSHEGNHVADIANVVANLPTVVFDQNGLTSAALNVFRSSANSKYLSEVRAYQTSIAAAHALGATEIEVGKSKNSMTQIWDQSWGGSGSTESTNAIDKHLSIAETWDNKPLSKTNQGYLIRVE